jgi:Family of unknown function (DUF5681)
MSARARARAGARRFFPLQRKETQTMQFQKGQSGNPAGRPRGSRNKMTVLMQNLLEGEAEAITRKVIDMAKEGDMAAIRVCMDRLVPARRSGAIACELPPLETRGGAVSAMAAIIAAVAVGDVTPAEAASLARVIDRYMFARSLAEYEERQAGPPASNDCQARLRSL